jgi:hypothetical protein
MAVKVLGVLAVVAVALGSRTSRQLRRSGRRRPFPRGVALILVLFAYGGWNEMAYVAAEVQRSGPQHRARAGLGTVAVMALIPGAHGAFVYGLGYAGLAASDAVATVVRGGRFSRRGRPLVSALSAFPRWAPSAG